ncbi:VCBS repeat-containing protein [Chromatiaceae bacterium AAb-1]|nr:VCBS repeat-containing protein [Chromatiaceae bacterium AAb-1]
MRLLNPVILLLAGLSFSSVAAYDLNKVTIKLGHPANSSIVHLPENRQLAVSGYSQFERWLTLVDLENFQATGVSVPDDMQFFDTATLAGTTIQQLVFLGERGIRVLDPVTLQSRLLLETSSLYRVTDKSRLRRQKFVVSLGSELSDFLVADFQQMHLYRQQPDGAFKHYALTLPSLVQSWRNQNEYEPRRYFTVDINRDGLPDLLFVQQGEFKAFLQQADGSFPAEPVSPGWPLTLATEQQADQRSDAGRSYSNANIDRLHDITDLDGDGLPDLVINREQLADALERNTRFLVYFGRQTEQGLGYQAVADTEIVTDTVPVNVEIADFNHDGKKDFYIASTHFGASTLIRVLLRGSANLDIDFYLLDEQRQYQSKADLRHNATINVSIGNFRYDMPLFISADISGVGHKTLLAGEGRSELRLYAPDAKRLFSRRSERIKIPLPRDGSRALAMDLTGNGKEDIILPFDAQDEEEYRNQLHLLLSR